MLCFIVEEIQKLLFNLFMFIRIPLRHKNKS
jgi:hypothetical protein